MLRLLVRGMSRKTSSIASQRTRAIGQHLMSTSAAGEEPVIFESNNSLRQYILNRPNKLNALDSKMIELLRPKIEEWNKSELAGTIVGTGTGRAFCAGGDVAAVVNNALSAETRPQAIEYFKQEFELDYILASLEKPYVAILDGITMGGGVGLASGALFRVATEKTVFAMPETKIGYFPDVGGSYYLSRLDGELGTYLALTGDVLEGRAVFEHGIATHFIPSRRVPLLLQRLAELNDPTPALVNSTIEELSSESSEDETRTTLIGAKRAAIDTVFRHTKVEIIMEELEQLTGHDDESVKVWASSTLAQLNERSPTSLMVSLKAIREGKKLQLREALNLELNIAATFCGDVTSDFQKGVEKVLILKEPGRPEWSPSTVSEVSQDIVDKFFDPSSPHRIDVPDTLQVPSASRYFEYALPTEEEIGAAVKGSHANAGDMGATTEEIVALFERLRQGKLGVREKVQEVLQRRCTLVDNADGNFVWLKWIHN